MNAVQFDRVSRHYGEVKAVDDISFQIPAGEFFTLLGPMVPARLPACG